MSGETAPNNDQYEAEVDITHGGLVTAGMRITESMGALSASSALHGVASHMDEYLEGLFTVSKTDIADDGIGGVK